MFVFKAEKSLRTQNYSNPCLSKPLDDSKQLQFGF